VTRPVGLRERKGHRLASQVYAATEYEFYFTVCARHQGEPFRNARLAETVIDNPVRKGLVEDWQECNGAKLVTHARRKYL